MKIFKLPDLGEGLPDAEIQQWHVAEGEEVKADQILVAMETAKAVVDVPSPYSGRITKLYGKPGDIIKTGAPLIAFEGEDITESATQKNNDAGTVVGAIQVGNTILNESPTGVAIKSAGKTATKAMPAARALAAKLNVDLASVTATGPNNTITIDDVNRAATATHPAGTEPLHSTRRTMATIMAKSHAEVVPVTIVEDADIQSWPTGTDVTYRLLGAIIHACKIEPALNAHFFGANISRKLFQEINIGIAVDTANGLFVPVIKNAGNQTAENLRKTINEFKTKGKTQSFSPQDLQNATITLSNFGTIAGRYANPIIVPPAVAIIGVGKSRDTVVAHENKPAIHRIMPICLTFDHRAVTGGEAARFLAAFIEDLTQ